MIITPASCIFGLGLCLALAAGFASAKPKNQATAAPLTEAGEKLNTLDSDLLSALQKEVGTALPKAAEMKKSALEQAQEEMKKAEAAAAEAQKNLGTICTSYGWRVHAWVLMGNFFHVRRGIHDEWKSTKNSKCTKSNTCKCRPVYET